MHRMVAQLLRRPEIQLFKDKGNRYKKNVKIGHSDQIYQRSAKIIETVKLIKIPEDRCQEPVYIHKIEITLN